MQPGGRAPEIVDFEEAVVGFFVDGAGLLGVPKSVAAIYGICFASPEPLGFTEITERLAISAGSVSQGLRVLRDAGALKVVTSPLEKRDRFEPDMELRRMATHWLEARLQKQLEAGGDRLAAIARSVPSKRTGSAKLLQTRLKALQSWHGKSRALLPIVKAFLSVG